MSASNSYGCDRGEAVNLARNIRGQDACVVTDKGIDTLAEAVLRMDEELTQLYADLDDACNIALAVSGHFSEHPDEWLRGLENRLRELQQKARASRRATHSPEGEKHGT
jgi:hypothetical protein